VPAQGFANRKPNQTGAITLVFLPLVAELVKLDFRY
jgi:hypothetical protein